MIVRGKRVDRVRSALRQLRDRTDPMRQRVQRGLRTGYSRASPVLAFVLVFALLSAPALVTPVAAQQGNNGGNGSGLVTQTVCESEMSTLASAVFTLLVMALSAYGVWRIGNGLRKYGDPRSEVKREGIESVKGGGISFAGAIFVLISPQLLSQLGLNFTNCISITGI
jgi:hypothetical protein